MLFMYGVCSDKNKFHIIREDTHSNICDEQLIITDVYINLNSVPNNISFCKQCRNYRNLYLIFVYQNKTKLLKKTVKIRPLQDCYSCKYPIGVITMYKGNFYHKGCISDKNEINKKIYKRPESPTLMLI